MGNIPKDQVICKCLNLLDLSDKRDKTLDFRAQKLTVTKLVKMVLEAELRQHDSLGFISEHLRSSPLFQQFIDLDSISKSQISRKLRAIPYTYSQSLFLRTIQKLQLLTKDRKGIAELGRLRIIDSSELVLPSIAGQWAVE